MPALPLPLSSPSEPPSDRDSTDRRPLTLRRARRQMVRSRLAPGSAGRSSVTPEDELFLRRLKADMRKTATERNQALHEYLDMLSGLAEPDPKEVKYYEELLTS